MHTLAALLPELLDRNLGWLLFAVCVIAGVIVGFSDMARLSLKRIWAIGGVCFDESIRRRVLWITPLAILGIIIVSQLQKPLDEQNAIRQTVKICVFATGLLVAVTTIILACTNLPREIENRVIYTVVTKPTTRLEIVLGKVVGFARVSLTILLIMGVFSWAYLSLRAWNMRRVIVERLETGAVAATGVASLKYYRDAGLLNAKTVEVPHALEILARLPEASGQRRYFAGSGEGSFIVPFEIDPSKITPSGTQEPGAGGLMVVARVGYTRSGTAPEPSTAPATTSPTTLPYYGPFIMSPEERQAVMSGVRRGANPEVGIAVETLEGSIGSAEPFGPIKRFELINRNGLTELRGIIDPKTARMMKGTVYIRVTGLTPDVEFFTELDPAAPAVELIAPKDERDFVTLSPLSPPLFQSRTGTFGFQLRGGEKDMPTAIFAFRGANVTPDRDNMVPFELRAGIERSGTDEIAATGSDLPTRVSVRIFNSHKGAGQAVSDEVIVEPESNRTVFFRLPAASVAGGDFDVRVKCLTGGDFLGLKSSSLVLITSSQPFMLNLAKSMLILWLLTVLITTVAIFTSTFLSWPIAVVLTLVILLGHWGVQQLGDAIAPGIGAQVVTDFGLKSPAQSEAVRATVEKLSSFLNFLGAILPDISRFAAMEEIERGISIPLARLRDALGVTLGFGLPMVLLAYIFLKNKEVAP